MFKLSMMTKEQILIIFGLSLIPNVVTETVKFVKKNIRDRK